MVLAPKRPRTQRLYSCMTQPGLDFSKIMIKRISQTQAHQDLIRRYLLWMFKTTKESFERIERKTTQLMVDEYVLERIKRAGSVPARGRRKYDGLVKGFETYIKTKREEELKLKFSEGKEKTLHPQYVYLKNRLQAVEAAIRHFLGEKELRAMRSLYEKEFTGRILQAREY
jgi:hypothetical protein